MLWILGTTNIDYPDDYDGVFTFPWMLSSVTDVWPYKYPPQNIGFSGSGITSAHVPDRL